MLLGRTQVYYIRIVYHVSETYNIWDNSQNIFHESKLVNKLSLVASITIEKCTESNGMTRLTP